MNPADRTDAILHGDGNAAPVINTDGVARADHAEVTEDGRMFLTASEKHAEMAEPLLPSYDELQQCCGEMEGEAENMRVRLIAVTEQRDRAWKACTDTFHECQKDEKGCDPFCCGPILLDVMARLQAVVAEAATVNP